MPTVEALVRMNYVPAAAALAIEWCREVMEKHPPITDDERRAVAAGVIAAWERFAETGSFDGAIRQFGAIR